MESSFCREGIECKFPQSVRCKATCRNLRKKKRSNYPESVISKIPGRKIAKENAGEDKNWKNQNSGMFSAVSEKIRTDYICFRWLQRLSPLFQRKSALIQCCFRALKFGVFQRCSELNQGCSKMYW